MTDTIRLFRVLPFVAFGLALTACASAPAPAGPFADPEAISYAPALGVNLTTATRLRNGMYVHDVVAGAGPLARSASHVRLHYALYLPDGAPVQTTRGSDPILVRLDNEEFVIRAAIVGMRAGGRRTIVVPPERGYGRTGVPGLIPPNTTLVFDVELIAITS